MKKISIFFLAMIIVFISSCEKDEQDYNNSFKYKVSVAKNGAQESSATVMYILSETEEHTIQCDKNGVATIVSDKPVKLIVAMSLGSSGIKEISQTNNSEINIDLEDVIVLKENSSTLKSLKFLGTFGVYSTDAAGDVKFRYQGAFVQYYCSSYLPWLGTTTNPNGWGGWDLTDFLPWKGKKLLVPTRYQQYHNTVYGFSISQALFLTANI